MKAEEAKRIKEAFLHAYELSKSITINAGNVWNISKLNQLQGYLKGCSEGMDLQDIE